MPQRQSMMTTKLRILWPATECHWSETEEGHSSGARRLEFESEQGCFMKTSKAFADPSAMTKQRREGSDSWSVPPLITILCWQTFLVFTKRPEDGLGNPKWTTPLADWLHFIEEALPNRSEHCQNTKFSGSRRLAADDLPPSSEKSQQVTRLRFDLEKLEDPNVLETFPAMTG